MKPYQAAILIIYPYILVVSLFPENFILTAEGGVTREVGVTLRGVLIIYTVLPSVGGEMNC